MWWLSSLLTNLALLLMSTGKRSIWYTHLHTVSVTLTVYVCVHVLMHCTYTKVQCIRAFRGAYICLDHKDLVQCTACADGKMDGKC